MVELEKIESNGVSWDEIRSNERAYARRELLKMGNPVECLKGLWEARIANARAEVVHKNAVARLRLLATELALRCYEADHGRAPANLAELVPEYTQRVASDPFSGRPMIYRPQGTNWLLYSVGQDGVDDGGKRVGGSVSASATGGDLFYDSRY